MDLSWLASLTTLFNAHPLAQSVGLVALFIGISAFWQQDDQRLRLRLTAYCAIIGTHFWLMGSIPAALGAWLSGGRTLVSVHTRNPWLMVVFLIVVWGLGVPHITEPVQWLPLIGTTTGTWGLFRERGIRMRLCLLSGTVCWVTHNAIIGSIGGTLIEGSFLFINGGTVIRLWRQQLAMRPSGNP